MITELPRLGPGKTYNVQFQATYDSGLSTEWSGSYQITTPANSTNPTAPGAPTLSAGMRSLLVTWIESSSPDIANGRGTYEVEIATNSGFSINLQSVKTTGTIATFTGLTSGVTYWARVKVRNFSGLISSVSASNSISIPLASSLDIEANSITAAMIQTDAVRASHILAGEINAGHLNAASILTNSIQSTTFASGSSGWYINRTGSAEFNNIVLRNNIDIKSSLLTTANRIEITSTSIKAFKGTNGTTPTFAVDGATGNVDITGNFTLDSSPAAGTQGLKFQSSAADIQLWAPEAGTVNPGRVRAYTSGSLGPVLELRSHTTSGLGFPAMISLRPSTAWDLARVVFSGTLESSSTYASTISSSNKPNVYIGSDGYFKRTTWSPWNDASDLAGAGTDAGAQTIGVTVGGFVRKTGSSIKIKTSVETVDFDEINLDAIRPVRYRSKRDFMENGESARFYPGLIAEELYAVEGWQDFITFDQNGDPDGIMYDRIVVPLIGKIRSLTARVEALEAL